VQCDDYQMIIEYNNNNNNIEKCTCLYCPGKLYIVDQKMD